VARVMNAYHATAPQCAGGVALIVYLQDRRCPTYILFTQMSSRAHICVVMT
jgi:hypothetical protein